eukprot:TRINITY_DN12495_c0_g1_i1.p1 TRINITY_DN12495_c0_g1~~TRINITY_DN12495_c0_g1_i1.p1  ORF type:complete len:958 (+),score=186.73 TRINITY_DN12495_c0_g1_i1:138-3011(+)
MQNNNNNNLFFKTRFGTYIEVSLPKSQTSDRDLVFCVDVSGSMGSVLKEVTAVLDDIASRATKPHTLYVYDTSVTKLVLDPNSKKSVALKSGGSTSFVCIFQAIIDHLRQACRPTSFIFMTDGEDTVNDAMKLKKSMDTLKLITKSLDVIVHVMGFGSSVNDNFLKRVGELGTRPGVFRYSTKSAELTNDFNDMFEFSTNVREINLLVPDTKKTYTSHSNGDYAGFLIPPEDEVDKDGDKTSVEVVVELGKTKETVTVVHCKDPKAILRLRALAIVPPESEEVVRSVLHEMSYISSSEGDMMERIEIELMKKEISDRIMELISLLTQIKMGQVPEEVKLKLSALRHDAVFSDLHRKKKLDLRVNKNMEYFKKTDIKGILEGYLKSLPKDEWNEIRKLRDDWVCAYSSLDLSEIMKKSPDEILCLGILVKRQEEAIDAPTRGLELVEVSNTVVSFGAFVRAMERGREQSRDADYGEFSECNEAFCIVGTCREKINAVVPLYLHPQHMKRVRILEGIWLGHLYTLDSCGYDKHQELGLLQLLHQIIAKRQATQRNAEVIAEIEKVCRFVVEGSLGFKTAYGTSTYSNFLGFLADRSATSHENLLFPLMIAHLTGRFEEDVPTVFRECVRRLVQGAVKKGDGGITDGEGTRGVIRKLVYGQEKPTTVSVLQTPAFSTEADHLEKSYVEFFNNETKPPIPLVPEHGATFKASPAIADTTELVPFLKSLMGTAQDLQTKLPSFFTDMVAYRANPTLERLVESIDFEALRMELLLTLDCVSVPRQIFSSFAVYKSWDERLTGRKNRGHSFNLASADSRDAEIVVNKIVNTKSLEAFGGLMRKYCSDRYGALFDRVVSGLCSAHTIDAENSRNKILALLTNKISHTVLYSDLAHMCWQPLVPIKQIRDIVGDQELKRIEKEHLDARKTVYHVYRSTNKPNRCGHCNHNPYRNNSLLFIGYSYPA